MMQKTNNKRPTEACGAIVETTNLKTQKKPTTNAVAAAQKRMPPHIAIP